jgi:hypothetical protein
MRRMPHRGVLLLTFAIGFAACEGPEYVRADNAATRHAGRDQGPVTVR